MTDPATNPSPDALPSNVQPTFRDGLSDPALRQAAERSVATIAARAGERVAKMRSADVERAKLADALHAPFKKLLDADSAAAKALYELQTQPLLDSVSMQEFDLDQRLAAADTISNLGGGVPFFVTPVAASVAVRVPPYDFGWSWFNLAGSPPYQLTVNNATGRVGAEARSGSVESGAAGFVEVHAGFGLFLATDRPVTATRRSFRFLEIAYDVATVGIGSNAVSEGLLEFTVLEDGRPIKSAVEKIWRARVSGSFSSAIERVSYEEGPHAWFEPRELSFRMVPGRG